MLRKARAAAARGETAEAAAAAAAAIAAAPDSASLQREGGLLLATLGRGEGARAALQRARQLAPEDAGVAEGLGWLALANGAHAAAAAEFGRAISRDPARAGSRIGLGRVLLAAGRQAEAVDAFETAMRLDPTDPRGPHHLGLLYLDRGLHASAAAALGRAVELAPRMAAYRSDLGLARQTAGDLAGAEAAYRAALAIDPDDPGALRGLARIAELKGAPEAGIALLAPLVESGRARGGLMALYGRLLGLVGRREEAIALLESRLADLGGAEDRTEVGFALAALLDAAGEPARAIHHAAAANRLKGAVFEPAAYDALIDRLLAVFDRRAMARFPRAVNAEERPVFVVGMPRSGTSLVEQILASHPAVYGAGELTEIGLLALATAREGRAYPESVAGLDARALTALADVYRGRLDELAPGALRVVDKMWQNVEYLGFIALLFPAARIVHCRRDPADVGLSCYFQHFFGQGVPFAYDLAHIGRYHRAQARAMAHWRAVLDLPLLDVEYERLVADPETEIRRLVEFAGLSWDPACLRFHETERVVRTASHAQVRRPIYGSSVGRHRAYAPWLEPLYRALAGD